MKKHHLKKLKKPPVLAIDPIIRAELIEIKDKINRLIDIIEELRRKR